MHLVDNVNLKPSLGGAVSHLIPDLTDIVDTVVGCRVDLDDIGGDPCLDCLAGRTFVTGTSVHRMFTVHGFCQNFGNRSLTCPACSAEQVSMSEPVGLNLIFQCCNNVILPFDIRKGVRPEFPVKSSITHSFLS